MREIRTEENLVESMADSTAPLIRSYGFSKAVTEVMDQYKDQLPTDDIRRQSIRTQVEKTLRTRAIAAIKKNTRKRAEIKRSPQFRFQFRPMRKG